MFLIVDQISFKSFILGIITFKGSDYNYVKEVATLYRW